MKNPIPSSLFNPSASMMGRRYFCLPILPGEISGAQTFAGAQAPSTEQALSHTPDTLSVFFFVKGSGLARVDDRPFSINPWSLLIPGPGAETIFVSEPPESLEYLEIIFSMTPEDKKDLEQKQGSLPYFIRYADCKKYKEAIKSEKTINRTLVPENIIPRFCMGSVETSGPDAVGVHKHPMLEQLFFGLAENACTVKADDTEAPFGEYNLLHIPLGSEHGVYVAEGRKLHYLWLDFFKDKKGIEWITQMHKPDDK
jgi:mannose-6-phosphate isomerase-like protein (cupin superfamily)